MGSAFVSGGAIRVGSIIAKHLAQNGYDILLHYNTSEKSAMQTQEEILSYGVACDLVKANFQYPELLKGIFDEHKVDLLVNSASTFPKGRFDDISLDSWNRTIAVNLTAPMILIQEMVRTQTRGVVVNIGDTLAERTSLNFAEHGISKAALKHLTLVAAKELAPNFRVNMIVPGPILIPETMSADRWNNITARIPLGGGNPLNIASMVLQIAKNDYMTGSVVHVDGGDHLL